MKIENKDLFDCEKLITKINFRKNLDKFDKKIYNNFELPENFINKKSKEIIQRNSNLHGMELINTEVNVKYNCLCLDGGGLRGIFASLFLSQLEQDLHIDLSSLFSLIGGTSTGGNISALLCIPDEFSEKPKFKARDILQMYCTKLKDIFVPNNKNIFFNSKYSSEGRSKLVKEFFGNTKLISSLTNLMLTSVENGRFNQSYIFDSFMCKKNSFIYKNDFMSNVSFYNAVMATTAAPTYFDPHKIGEKYYIDGGIHLNNPSSRMITEVVKNQNILESNIHVLSIGTGFHSTNCNDIGEFSGIAFWGKNISNYIMCAQEPNTNMDMYFRFKERYTRWDVFMSKKVEMDDYSQLDFVIETGKNYLAEIKFSEEYKSLLKYYENQIGL